MEDLNTDQIVILLLLLSLAMTFVVVLLWRVWRRRVQRGAALAMKQGNRIYREWRHDTVRQPLE